MCHNKVHKLLTKHLPDDYQMATNNSLNFYFFLWKVIVQAHAVLGEISCIDNDLRIGASCITGCCIGICLGQIVLYCW